MIYKIPLDPPFTKGEAKNKNTFTISVATSQPTYNVGWDEVRIQAFSEGS